MPTIKVLETTPAEALRAAVVLREALEAAIGAGEYAVEVWSPIPPWKDGVRAPIIATVSVTSEQDADGEFVLLYTCVQALLRAAVKVKGGTCLPR